MEVLKVTREGGNIALNASGPNALLLGEAVVAFDTWSAYLKQAKEVEHDPGSIHRGVAGVQQGMPGHSRGAEKRTRRRRKGATETKAPAYQARVMRNIGAVSRRSDDQTKRKTGVYR